MTSPTNGTRWRNWGGNQQAVAVDVLTPASVDEVSAAVKTASESGRRVKAVGSGHSFTSIAVADDQRLQLHRLADLISIDEHLVTVGAGMTIYALNSLLAAHGLAVPNLGDIDAQTVAGAIATGTHGTGRGHSTIASCVEAVTLVTGAGQILHVDSSSEYFPAVRLGLGALGVLVDVTLTCTDAFTLMADERPMALTEVLARVGDDIAANEHVEFYWYPYTDRAQLKRNNPVPASDRPLSRFRGWLDDDFLSNTDRSDRVFCTSRRVHFVEMEYAVPRTAMPEVLAALPRIIDGLPFKVQFPVEVRFTGPDDVWLSHSYGRESAYIAVHQYAGSPYEPYFRAVEAVCVPLGGRPHWGKMHYRDADSLRTVYPRFDDFLAVREKLDPARVFTNGYLDRVLGA